MIHRATPSSAASRDAADDVVPPAPATPPVSRTVPRMTVRRAVMRDLDTIVELRLALLRLHAENPLHGRIRADAPLRARRLYAQQLRALDEVIFLAERDGEPLGVLRCARSSGTPMLDPVTYGYVSSVYVVPEARRQGVLRALLRAAERWCRRRGLVEMRLHNSADDPVANTVWDALGFELAEVVRVRRLR